MSDFGFKISLPGYDTDTASPERCAIHSTYPALKSKTNQTNLHFALLTVNFTATITQNVNQTIYSFAHGYSYTPLTIANIVFRDSGGVTEVGLGFVGIGATLAINAYCDDTNFKVDIYDDFNWTSNTAVLQVSYYIFAEPGT